MAHLVYQLTKVVASLSYSYCLFHRGTLVNILNRTYILRSDYCVYRGVFLANCLYTEMTMMFHNLASIFPLMTEEEYQALVRDIERNGLLEPVWLYEGKIIDGRNRYRACLEL